MTARVSGRWGAGSLLVRPTRAHVQDRGVGLGRQGSSNKRCWCLRMLVFAGRKCHHPSCRVSGQVRATWSLSGRFGACYS